MAKKINEKFLNIYKALESVIREDDPDNKVSDYEAHLPPDRSDKLRMCRYVRNYLQHNADGDDFIQASAAMCDFLNHEITLYNMDRMSVGDMMTRIKAYDKKATLEETLKALKRHDCIPIVDDKKKLAGVINRENILTMVLNAAGKLSKKIDQASAKKALKAYRTLDRDTPASHLSQLDDTFILIVDKSGKYVGVIER